MKVKRECPPSHHKKSLCLSLVASPIAALRSKRYVTSKVLDCLLSHLAHGDYPRSANGSQNRAVLPKRHDETFFAANKNKDNTSNTFFENSGFNLTRNNISCSK